ncbi:HIRAN domain-containing protein [Antribacter sp. KLBMP9083]|uniref:HIRAN domain-containing protein n=1 Tax=Antribacter soli TaxID=2910976 RepID=A0AA41QF93_9MICO|nr:HIRAN domain-containing protein [Antribacter soli]MCF4121730.1 HIRAN domain-containing protein [Antribacter soli]
MNWHEVDDGGLDYDEIVREYDELVDAARVKVVTVDTTSLRILDLTDLESTRTRIKGPARWLRDGERKEFGGREYLLIREPDNEADASAVAVFSTKGRKVGHLSASRAASLSPILDAVDAGAFRVTGTGTTPNSTQLWVDVPKMDPLRRRLRG